MLTLRSGEASLVLAPETGGAIVGRTFGTVPLLRRPAPDAIVSGNVRGLACTGRGVAGSADVRACNRRMSPRISPDNPSIRHEMAA